MPKADNERLIYCRVMTAILRGEGTLAQLQKPGFADAGDLNRALLQQWCYGVCRWFHRLDGTAKILLEKPLRNKDLDVYCLILLGLYQLSFMQTPDHAVINEAVVAVDALNKPWAKGLVNGVLREAQRRRVELDTLAETDYSRWYSHPDWLLSRIKKDWPSNYRDILEANNVQAPMTLRVNQLRTDRESFISMLAEAGIAAHAGTLADTAVVLDKAMPVREIPGFAEGLASVQDEASQLVSQILPLEPGLGVLDACAAPGGKTCALLEAQPGLDLLAIDNDDGRLGRARENLDRLQLAAKVEHADILQQNAAISRHFERILLDVPCSGTGVIRRHPDIKVLRSPAEVSALKEKQHALLRAAWPLLETGGYLLYSTCSVLREENELQIMAFLEETNEAKIELLEFMGNSAGKSGLQLFPRNGSHDGFYYALLRKY